MYEYWCFVCCLLRLLSFVCAPQEDSFAALHALGPRLKGRVMIRFVDETGLPEAGIDGGGLFKEFMNALLKSAFDEAYGLFRLTTDRLLFPNPDASLMTGGDGEDGREARGWWCWEERMKGERMQGGVVRG